MVDQRPPRLAGDELAVVHALLQYHRDSIVRKVTGVSEADAASSPVQSGTSLLWLMQHLSRTERMWVFERFAGRDPGLGEPPATLEAAVELYRQTWRDVDEVIFAAPSLDEPGETDDPAYSGANLRWVVTHLLEETARHAGHADIIRELLDGSTGR